MGAAPTVRQKKLTILWFKIIDESTFTLIVSKLTDPTFQYLLRNKHRRRMRGGGTGACAPQLFVVNTFALSRRRLICLRAHAHAESKVCPLIKILFLRP